MYEEQTPGEAGAGVGDPERFAQVLREAIAGSGLTLAAISRTLRRRDLPASPATLSSWQSGARHPDWERSREVLEALEEVVKIEPGTLSSLVAPRRRRGRPPERGDLAMLMPPGTSAVREALVELGFRTPEDFPMEQTIVEHALVDTDASTLEMTFLTQVKATADGICALPNVHLLETAGGPDIPQIGALGGCRVARRVSKRDGTVVGARIEVDGPLQQGQVAVVSYRVALPVQMDEVTDIKYSVSRRILSLMVEVEFRGSRPLRDLRTVIHPEPGEVTCRPAVLDQRGRVQCAVTGFGPGLVGVTWNWAD
ncbi:hypothetical protein [Brachybacterium sp. Marseille-Q7125]|uniref:hypothetical protein n=1 Tax=Brachybacterium sp. Marseille-Q7125 TaxID=2932815 RepID=UPI001FF14179|nr:hypothetical protein [Brachybacterium sp. Marseille-Q7125]